MTLANGAHMIASPRPAVLALVLAAAFLRPLPAQEASPATGPLPVATLDSIAESLVRANRSIGVAIAVARGSEPAHRAAFGLADVEWQVPMPADAMFEVGSLAKQFAAASILQLRDAGKLSLDDPITKWFTGLDTGGHGVTLRHLLTHTSGIARFSDSDEWERMMFLPGMPRDSAMRLVQLTPFAFAPGTAQAYSNSGFWLLGVVVEKASGLKYEDYLASRIFEPLGMTRSMFCDGMRNVPRRAHGYGLANGVITRAPMVSYAWVGAPGAVCSTAEDLVAWMRALHGGKVMSADSYKEMTTPARLLDGTATQYGMGIKVGTDLRGWRYIGHGGSAPGFRADATWYPDAQLAVVALMNTSAPGLSGATLGLRLVNAALPARRAEPEPYRGDASRFIGNYELVRGGNLPRATLTVTSTPNGLAFSINGSRPQPLPWAGGATFFGGETTTLTFVGSAGPDAPFAELHRDDPGNHAVLVRRP